MNNATFLVDPAPVLIGGTFHFKSTPPESAYIALLVETGIVGFAISAGFLIVVLARAYHNVRAAIAPAAPIGILAGLAAILLGNLTVVGLTSDQPGMLFGALIGMAFTRMANARVIA